MPTVFAVVADVVAFVVVDEEEAVVGALVVLLPVATLDGATDADISRRSPGRKFGHDFGFN
jgi:hypothetical protein